MSPLWVDFKVNLAVRKCLPFLKKIASIYLPVGKKTEKSSRAYTNKKTAHPSSTKISHCNLIKKSDKIGNMTHIKNIKKIIISSFSLILLLLFCHFLNPSTSPSHNTASLQNETNVKFETFKQAFTLDKDLHQKREKPLSSKKTSSILKTGYIKLFFFRAIRSFKKYFLIDCSFKFLHLDILSSRSHPPTDFCLLI